jgi:Raf kinase inhibitor-like YbhB/YbcL family protein
MARTFGRSTARPPEFPDMRRALVVLWPALLLTSCGGRSTPTASALPDEPATMTIRLHSPAFADGAPIPPSYTCDGQDISPPLSWSGVPEAARALALICEDPDAPRGTWTHWLLFNLPASVTGLKEGLPTTEHVSVTPDGKEEEAARQGRNDFGTLGYGGPCPPGGTHRYVFRLYALDTRLDPGSGATREPLLRAMTGHVLATGRLIGRYAR